MKQLKSKQLNVPKLRFPAFSGEWQVRRIADVLERVSIPVGVQPNVTYREIGIRSHGKGVFHKEPTTGKQIGDKRVFEVVPNTLAFNIVFAWEQALAILTEADQGFIASHRFPMYVEKENRSYIRFLRYYFLRPRGKYLLELASPGGAGRNKTLGQSDFSELKLTLPERAEQVKIADFLTAIDERASLLEQKISVLEEYKRGCLQQIFSKSIRFRDEQNSEFPDWEKRRIGDVLKIGSGRDYKHLEKGDIPVYGTGGYMTSVNAYLYDGESVGIGRKGTIDQPVLLSGKFWTVDTLFYTHKHKGVVPRFVHVLFQRINWKKYNEASGVPSLSKGTIEDIEIDVPCEAEQIKVADFVNSIDEKISLVKVDLEMLQTFKKGLLQKLFI